MEIYLLRHGIAADAKPGQSDASRALTEEGREKLARVLGRAGKAGMSPSLILSSPLRRAIETAEVAAQTLEYGRLCRHMHWFPKRRPRISGMNCANAARKHPFCSPVMSRS